MRALVEHSRAKCCCNPSDQQCPHCLTSLRSAAADAIKFTVDQTALKKRVSQPASVTKAASMLPDATPTSSAKPMVNAFLSNLDKEAELAKMVCSLENKDACLMCGS